MFTPDSLPDLSDLREELSQVEGLTDFHDLSALNRPKHVEQIGRLVGVLSEAFDRCGIRCVLIGGAALELFAPSDYSTGDVDLGLTCRGLHVPRATLDRIFKALGCSEKQGRHWIIGRVMIEVPAGEIDDPTVEITVGSRTVQCIAVESLIVERLSGFEQTGHTGSATQAAMLLRSCKNDILRELLVELARREHVLDVLVALEVDLENGVVLTDSGLGELLEQIHKVRKENALKLRTETTAIKDSRKI